MAKPVAIAGLTLVLCWGCSSSPYKPADNVTALDVSLANSAWDGSKVPKGQQCQRFGGSGVTPEIVVSGIPDGANAIILRFSDRDSQSMNNGGHGSIGYAIDLGETSVTVPSVPGHTFDLPPGFFLVEAHRNPAWDKAGAYMPPCSGGRGNRYYADVKAVYKAATESEQSTLLGQARIELGRY